jgi:hypothetical protein
MLTQARDHSLRWNGSAGSGFKAGLSMAGKPTAAGVNHSRARCFVPMNSSLARLALWRADVAQESWLNMFSTI